jgi:hypothetical protein
LPLNTDHHFTQFIARVTDVSTVVESKMRDANRTFLASLNTADSNSAINIHGLNPGHQYNIAILGRRQASQPTAANNNGGGHQQQPSAGTGSLR